MANSLRAVLANLLKSADEEIARQGGERPITYTPPGRAEKARRRARGRRAKAARKLHRRNRAAGGRR